MSERVRLIVEVLRAYCAVRWRFRGSALPATVESLRGQRTLATPQTDDDCFVSASRLAYAVQNVLVLLPTDSRCLMRSLVLTRVLARRGMASSLVIGVGTASGFAAHAWVEMNGVPLLPDYPASISRIVEL